MLSCCIASPYNVTWLVLLTPVAVSPYAQQHIINTVLKQILYYEEIDNVHVCQVPTPTTARDDAGRKLSFVSVQILNIATILGSSL